MEFQPIKGKPTFDIDNLDNTSKVKTVETVEASIMDVWPANCLEFWTSDILPLDIFVFDLLMFDLQILSIRRLKKIKNQKI